MTSDEIFALAPSERDVARRIAKRGLKATYNGHVWHVTGTGVDLFAVKLSYIHPEDLRSIDLDQRR